MLRSRRRYIFCGLLALLLSYLLLLLLTGPGQRWREANPILAVAPAEPGQLLPVSSHIANSPRPAESFKFPIAVGSTGPAMPLYAGGLSYPLYCGYQQQGITPPQPDNQAGFGIVLPATKDSLSSYSKDCLHPTQLQFYLLNSDGDVSVYDGGTVSAGQLLLRLELGTINRFFYYIVMPISRTEYGSQQGASLWNGKLIYQFHGGVGIGYRQGHLRTTRLISDRQAELRAGFAILSSSVNKTSHTYNFLLAEDTARRVKLQFTALYGQPVYTLGIGGSGGGIAQYLLLQNSTDLLDGGIALYSYPDMLSQTLYALDCDLLHNYYYFTAANKAYWQHGARRQLLEGLSYSTEYSSKFDSQISLTQLLNGERPTPMHGATQCLNAWLGLSSLVHNPHQGRLKRFVTDPVLPQVNWSYWADLQAIFGTDKQGFAHSLWDNQGVQYGLQAVKDGRLSVTDFLAVNRNIGSWRHQSAMRKERIYFEPLTDSPLWLSAFGRHNITRPQPSTATEQAAARYRADQAAVTRAYRYGQLFLGMTNKPILDLRHYLDPQLDMHHLEPSFAARERLQKRNGHADNQLIWVSHPDYTPLPEAIALMDLWLSQQQKPAQATDQCFAADGSVIASGATVWQAGEPCAQRYPPLSNSRLQAGAPKHGLMFNCALISVDDAIARGDYLPLNMQPYVSQLRRIFPAGVCDYSLPDQAMPADLAFPY
ncbi:MAG: hypothetical protein KKE08_08020 [Gammaproteobacteria bacterium]|nr:hypothetical protein [Gammaproteobacteria bacterium]MBU2182956.1 hypothetical protein [Gammaproteobacteria bacterium]MBU2203304.1 hypothetical protein [Gammaproteobacteria bacterium]